MELEKTQNQENVEKMDTVGMDTDGDVQAPAIEPAQQEKEEKPINRLNLFSNAINDMLINKRPIFIIQFITVKDPTGFNPNNAKASEYTSDISMLQTEESVKDLFTRVSNEYNEITLFAKEKGGVNSYNNYIGAFGACNNSMEATQFIEKISAAERKGLMVLHHEAIISEIGY